MRFVEHGTGNLKIMGVKMEVGANLVERPINIFFFFLSALIYSQFI